MTSVVCKLELVNRRMATSGQNGKMFFGKCVIHLKSGKNLVVSTAKDVNAYRYDIAKIQRIRSNFIHEGRLTIEMKEPQISLLVSNSTAKELENFLKSISLANSPTQVNTLQQNNNNPASNNTTTTSRTNDKRTGNQVDSINKVSSSKRRLEQDDVSLSKIESNKIKRRLKENSSKLIVTDRSNYPRDSGFSKNLMYLELRSISLPRIDNRLLSLNQLTVLDLSGNRISTVDILQKLDSRLVTLILSNNEITSIDANLMYAKSMCSLKSLVLKKNKLVTLPQSIVNMKQLQYLDVTANELQCLPYNMSDMKRLQNLLVADNKLKFLPYTVAEMNLNHLDISGNDLMFCPPFMLDNGLNRMPTLFELSCDKIMTDPKLRGLVEQQASIPNQIPPLTLAHLQRCLRCSFCNKRSLRYIIIGFNVPTSVATTTTYYPGRVQFPTRKIICAKCAAPDDHKFYI